MIADRQQQQAGRQCAQHVVRRPGYPAGLLAQIRAQRRAGRHLPRRQRLQQIGIGHHQGCECRGGDRAGDQRPRRLLHHRAQVNHRATGSTGFLSNGNPEQAEFGNAVVHRAPGVGMTVLDVADGVGCARTGCPTPNQIAGGELFVGDGRRHRRLLRFGGV